MIYREVSEFGDYLAEIFFFKKKKLAKKNRRKKFNAGSYVITLPDPPLHRLHQKR